MLHDNVVTFAKSIGTDPLKFAILGGEDYALVGTVSPFEAGKAESIPGFTRIGTVTKTPGIALNGKPFTAEGFDHFSQ